MIRVIAFLLTLVCAVGAFIGFNLKQVTLIELNLDSPALYQVRPGQGVNALCHDFEQKGWVENCFWLKVYAKVSPDNVALQHGLYQLERKKLVDVINQINQGKTHQFAFTIVEGSTYQQVLENFATAPYLERVANEELTRTLNALGLITPNPEGWFYPDTYFYSAGDTQVAILTRAYNKMLSTLETLWQQRAADLPLNSPYEALILASIIEKESGHDAERDLISSVFINRLNKGMRLQTDPTVIYGLGEEYQGDIKSEHLRRYTAYNTYRIDGLPPTPIAMPSKEAIYATLNPRYSEYYYFVASGNGQHHFSKTLKQHNAAVRKYILKK